MCLCVRVCLLRLGYDAFVRARATVLYESEQENIFAFLVKPSLQPERRSTNYLPGRVIRFG